tara:strand:- start:211 stop:765 length:555 start_codon:yes stop_codon:yes gene_type:complete
MFDKIKAMSAPPGHSLTGEPGKWAWEQPPRFSDPNDAIDFIVDKLDERIPQEDMLKMMTAGITIEEIVNQISFKGFMQGQFNPDVAELIKPALAMFLMKLSIDNGFTPRLFIDEDPQPEVSDDRFFSIMKERNPELFNAMNEAINKGVRLEEQAAVNEAREIDEMPDEVDQGGFLAPIAEEETQ